MSLNKLFDTITEARQTANWQAAFGEPQVVGEKTIIPVARVSYGFGLGFGSGAGPSESKEEPAPQGEGGGVGGGAWARPLGALVITPDSVHFEETLDVGRIAMAALLLAGFLVFQLGRTVAAILRR